VTGWIGAVGGHPTGFLPDGTGMDPPWLAGLKRKKPSLLINQHCTAFYNHTEPLDHCIIIKII
jgi:hypothetical protein